MTIGATPVCLIRAPHLGYAAFLPPASLYARWDQHMPSTLRSAFPILLFASLASVCSFSSAPAADERPNILFIMSDDHAYQAISAYGSNRNQTPNIDRIAKE